MTKLIRLASAFSLALTLVACDDKKSGEQGEAEAPSGPETVDNGVLPKFQINLDGLRIPQTDQGSAVLWKGTDLQVTISSMRTSPVNGSKDTPEQHERNVRTGFCGTGKSKLEDYWDKGSRSGAACSSPGGKYPLSYRVTDQANGKGKFLVCDAEATSKQTDLARLKKICDSFAIL